MLNVRPCRVSFTDSEGITHTAEVSAGSLFEAAALGIAEFRRCGMMDVLPGLATQLTVAVVAPATLHEIPIRKLSAWLAGGGKSPAEQAGEGEVARNPRTTATGERHVSEETRARMAAAQQRRWAGAKRAGEPARKRNMSAEGKARTAEGARKRWEAYRAQ